MLSIMGSSCRWICFKFGKSTIVIIAPGGFCCCSLCLQVLVVSNNGKTTLRSPHHTISMVSSKRLSNTDDEKGSTCMSLGHKSRCNNVRSSNDCLSIWLKGSLLVSHMKRVLGSWDAQNVLRYQHMRTLLSPPNNWGAVKMKSNLGHRSTRHHRRLSHCAGPGILVLYRLSCTCRITYSTWYSSNSTTVCPCFCLHPLVLCVQVTVRGA